MPRLTCVCMFNHNREGKSWATLLPWESIWQRVCFRCTGSTSAVRGCCKTVSRARLSALVATLPRCLIGMEACSGAHEWARRFTALGHTVKLMAPKFVAPYRKSGKNDGNDAEAICEAVSRPSMRFVAVKSLEQQSILTVHRVRLGFVEERTASINRIRGLLAEFGVVLPQRAVQIRRGAAAALEQLPVMAAEALRELLAHVNLLDERIGTYERQLEQHARSDERAQRIQALSGVGPIGASALVASVADAHEFSNGRQFAHLAGTDSQAILHRRQNATRTHHGARRSVPANAADHGRPLDVADRATTHRSALPLGAECQSSSRLSSCVRGHRRQARTHHLGDAREEQAAAACMR